MKPHQLQITDEYRTPEHIGEAMCRAANVPRFDLDPFGAAEGYNGIPARERFTWKISAFIHEPQCTPQSIGFNVPFSQPRRALERVEHFAGEGIPVVGIVRADPSVAWWSSCIVEKYDWVVFTPRILFYNQYGQQTTGQPRGGVAIIGRNAPNSQAIHACVLKHYRQAWLVTI